MHDKAVLWSGDRPLCVHSGGNNYTCQVGKFNVGGGGGNVFVQVTDDRKTIFASGLPSTP